MMTTTPMGVEIFWSFKPLGRDALVENSAHRIGQRRDFAQSLRHAGDAFVVELEPVEHGGGEAQLARRLPCRARWPP